MPGSSRAHNQWDEAVAELRYRGYVLVHFPAVRSIQPVLHALLWFSATPDALNRLGCEGVNNCHVEVGLYSRIPREPHHYVSWNGPAACPLFDSRVGADTIERIS